MRIWGILLAAGAGRRMGMPKALMRDLQGHWLPRAVRTQLDGGAEHVIVALGASSDEASALLNSDADKDAAVPRDAVGISHGITHGGAKSSSATPPAARPLPPTAFTIINIEDWDEGLSASLRGALNEAIDRAPDDVPFVIVTTVDTPKLPTTAVERIAVAAAVDEQAALVQATWHGRPGHPVAIGRKHWGSLAASLRGDIGGREYLRSHHAQTIECSDTGDGADIDRPRGQ